MASGSYSQLEPGVVYIFNQETFDGETRVGTKEDVKALIETLGQFKMNISVFNDLGVKDIEAVVESIQQTDFTQKSCIVIVILSHGTRHEVVCAKDGEYSIDDDILFPMLQNQTLVNKPKIFIIQACKGDFATASFPYSDAKPSRHYSPTQITKFYSTFEGFQCYRGPTGSVFIQTLCYYLKKYGFTEALINIMYATIERIEKDYGAQQIPTITSNMTISLTFGDHV